MHHASMKLMAELRRCIEPGSTVLDVGGADVNGSYRELFSDCKYQSLDFQNADIIVKGYDWPIADGAFDTVICGQALEHDPIFWVTMQNIARVLRPGGHAILIVPSSGDVHRYPVDCWRFLPDAMQALAQWAGLDVLRTEWTHESKWNDLGAVFRKPV